MWGNVGNFLHLQKISIKRYAVTHDYDVTKLPKYVRKVMRFIGDYSAKTDAKGRVFLPSALRKTLTAEGATKLILRKDVFQKCLVLYPESVWNEKLDDLKSHLNPWKREHQAILRQFSADAEVMELDSNGRILIGKSKLLYAEIGADVRFLGVDDKIEVWSKENLDAILNAEGDLGTDIENLFA